MLSFKPTFSLSSFFHQEALSSKVVRIISSEWTSQCEEKQHCPVLSSREPVLSSILSLAPGAGWELGERRRVACSPLNLLPSIKGLPQWLSGKDPPAMQETQVRSLGQEDPPEEEMATHPVFLPGESHGQRSLAAIVRGVEKSRTRMSNTYTYTYTHITNYSLPAD